jgi:hypothetical protein
MLDTVVTVSQVETLRIEDIFSTASIKDSSASRGDDNFNITLAATYLDDALLNRHIEFK